MILEDELKALKWEGKDNIYLVKKNLRKLILWFDHQHAFNQTAGRLFLTLKYGELSTENTNKK